MKWLVALLALSLFGVSQALSLQEALESAPARPDAITTRLELINASNELVRAQSDPLALRMDLLQYEQNVELLQAELEVAHYSAQQEIADAYTSVLLAREQRELAQRGMELSEVSLEIARIRFENGGATRIDVREAEVALDDAQQSVAAARNGLAIAVANLEGMIGREVDPELVEPVPDEFLVDVPPQDRVLTAIGRHPNLLQSRQGLELAQVGLDLLDPAYASEAQIESADTQLATTRQLVAESERGFALQARNAQLQAQNAAETYQIEVDRLATARERLEQQRARLEAGLISEVEFRQAELETRQAEVAAMSARHDFLNALLDLQASTLVSLDGPFASFEPEITR